MKLHLFLFTVQQLIANYHKVPLTDFELYRIFYTNIHELTKRSSRPLNIYEKKNALLPKVYVFRQTVHTLLEGLDVA